MPKAKICISIDEALLAKIEAIRVHEKRSSISNALESKIALDNYVFIEITDKADLKPKFKVHVPS